LAGYETFQKWTGKNKNFGARFMPREAMPPKPKQRRKGRKGFEGRVRRETVESMRIFGR
jgi:hypothetical protein